MAIEPTLFSHPVMSNSVTPVVTAKIGVIAMVMTARNNNNKN